MMARKPDYSIYLVTDEDCLRGRQLLECVEAALQGGVSMVQYRAKHKDSRAMYCEAVALKQLCDSYNVPLIINDRLDIALAVHAEGVHLGQSDLPCSIARSILGKAYLIGVSAHNVEEACAAERDGADYLGCGAVFGTQTKQDAGTMGLTMLRAIRGKVSLPMVGIGGINAGNYAEVLHAGADGAAIVSGILAADDITAEVSKLGKIYQKNVTTK